MKLKQITLLLLSLFFVSILHAQNQAPCGSIANFSWENTLFKNTYEQYNTNNKHTRIVYTIPVVFHVIHQGGSENVPDTMIQSWLAEANLRYANSTPFQDATKGNNIGIQFCLATKDSLGNPTTGITRHNSPYSDMLAYINNNGLPITYPLLDTIAEKFHWNSTKYVNIYVVKNLVAYGGTYGGYGMFPSNHGMSLDGVFMDFDYYDTNPGSLRQYNPGLLEHELGHYLGCYHTFQGGCFNNNCTTDNDGVCDTPPDGTNIYGCVNQNTCSTDADDNSTNNPFRSVALGGIGDQNDDFSNYMDYTNCAVIHFTLGQKNRMISALTTTRQSLLSSIGCGFAIPTNNILEQNIVSISPNPCYTFINIKVNSVLNNIFIIRDATAKEVYRCKLTSLNNTLPCTFLVKGIYYYEYYCNSSVARGKIIKN